MINRLKSLTHINRRTLGIVSAVLAILFVAVYIGTVNGVATAGFEVSNLEKEIAILKKDRANLQLEASALGSMQRVEIESRSLSLVPVAEIEYLTTVPSVAIR